MTPPGARLVWKAYESVRRAKARGGAGSPQLIRSPKVAVI
jgi:hypothetical protein